MRDHTVIIGYGSKGRSACTTLLRNGVHRDSMVVVDTNSDAVAEANLDGFASVPGDATRTDVLERAEIREASHVVVAPRRDDTAVLVTLTARQLNPHATIVATAGEDENVPLLRQSGADTVVTSAATAGRLLGIATINQTVSDVLKDLLVSGSGLDFDERPVSDSEVGHSPYECGHLVIAVVRDDEAYRFDDPHVQELAPGDRLVSIRAPGMEARE